jgi:hypothetical protein
MNNANQPAAAQSVKEMAELAQAYRDAQDALDNHELQGPNAEPYRVVRNRRDTAREDLDAALRLHMENPPTPSAPAAGEGVPSDALKTVQALRELLDVLDDEPRPSAPRRNEWCKRLDKAFEEGRALIAQMTARHPSTPWQLRHEGDGNTGETK